MSIVTDFMGKVGTAAGGLIDNVVLESDLTPRIVISQPLVDSGAPPNPIVAAILSRIRPRAVVNYTAESGLSPIVVAPYGTPTPLSDEQSTWAAVVLVGIGIGALVLVWRGLFCHAFKVPHRSTSGLGETRHSASRSASRSRKGKGHAKR
jgi:hypothetical protein